MPEERLPFDTGAVLPFLAGRGWRGALRRGVEAALGLPEVRRRFREAEEDGGEPFGAALRAFGLEMPAPGVAEALPGSGPLLVVANHPFGGADALALGAICSARRPDTLVLANEMAAEIPALADRMLPLSILGREGSARGNARTLRRALDHLRRGGSLAVFPSGEVAWRGRPGGAEGPWSPHIVALAMKASATVLPVRFPGEAPWWFHRVGRLHPVARTALLPRVLLAMRGRTVDCRAAAPVTPDELGRMEDPAGELRRRVMGM